MNTKIVMTGSAGFLALLGISLTFAPDSVLVAAVIPHTTSSLLAIQLMGAMYFAFAVLNWMSKGAIVGGIYNRPLVVANLAHYLIGGLALVKMIIKYPAQPVFLIVLTVIYLLLAVLFYILMNKHPEKS